MSGQRRRLWVNIITEFDECYLFAQSMQQTQWWISPGPRRRQLTGIEPAMVCNAGPTLNRDLVGTQQT